MVEYGVSEPLDRTHVAGADVKLADDAFRELEENVSFTHELHGSLTPRPTAPLPPPRLKHDEVSRLAFNPPGCVSSLSSTGPGIGDHTGRTGSSPGWTC